jgi:zinc protease
MMRAGLAPSAPGLQPARATLDNGVVVLAKETRKTPAVAINLAIRAGSICDPVDAPGATYLLGRVIDRGTAARSADEIAEELDGRGISLTVNVTRHLFSVSCTCLARDFDAILALLGDIVIQPVVPQHELAIRKGEVITAIRQDDDNPAVRAVEGLMAMLYGEDHPYGRRTKGNVEVVERLTQERLLGLHAQRFAPSEMTAIVVGDVGASRALETAGRVFSGWRNPPPPPVPLPPVPKATTRRRRIIPMMNKAQADIAYGFTTIRRADPAYYACWIMNVALGQYALGGRLGDSIRERQGMAYYVSSLLDANVMEGPLMIRAGVGPANVDRAIVSIDEELTKLRLHGLTDKEVNETRQYLIGSMPRALETNAGIANFLQTEDLFGLGLDYDRRLPDLLGAVTLEDVHAAARHALDPDRATIVIAGPYDPITRSVQPGGHAMFRPPSRCRWM